MQAPDSDPADQQHGQCRSINQRTEDDDPSENVLRNWSQHGLKAELEEVAGVGERVLVGSRIPGLGASFGRPGEDQAYTVLTVRSGSIVAMRDCRDRRDALEVAGLEDPADDIER